MKKANSRHIRWVFQWSKDSKLSIAMLIITTIASSFASISIAYLFKDYVNIATGESTKSFIQITIMALFVVVAWGLFYVMSSLFKSVIYSKIEKKLRKEFLRAIYTRQFIEIQKIHSGELMTRLTNDIASVSGCIPDLISGVFGSIILTIISTCALFFLNWKLALILLVAMPLLIVALNVLSPFIQKISKANKLNEEENRKFMQESVSDILLFKSYNMAHWVLKNNDRLYKKKYNSSIKLSVVEGLGGFLNILLGMSLFLLVLGIGSYFAIHGEVSIGTLIAMLQLMNTIINPFSAVSRYLSQIAQSSASVERIREVIELSSESTKVSDVSIEIALLTARGVSFSYSEDEILKDVTLEIKPSEIVGLVGESGSGKSTLTKLLMGVYEPKAGTVELVSKNGVTINDKLAFISYVPSDNFLFHGTIKENICMGDDVDENQLINSAKSANIHEFICSLPNGYEQIIGEGSNLLSSGQSQRIGIARALYKDSPMLIFDEPTSNLDTEAINVIHKTIKEVAHGKLCLVVTHDLSTKDLCDRLYSITEGKVLPISPI